MTSGAEQRSDLLHRWVWVLLNGGICLLAIYGATWLRFDFKNSSVNEFSDQTRGLPVDQSVGYAVWLGIAVFAIILSDVLLWRTRRLLSQARQDHCVTQVSFKQASVAESTSSAVAS